MRVKDFLHVNYLIERWQVLSYGKLAGQEVTWHQSRHAKLRRDRCALVMPGKRKRYCPFSSWKRRRKKAKKSFNQECAAILAASDRGSYYNQREWLEEVEDHVNNREVSEQTVDQMSASRAKIQLNESVEVFRVLFCLPRWFPVKKQNDSHRN